MTRQDTRQRLLDTGIAYVIQHGYHHSGLNEILGAAGVPKGSFYYYFHSKEDFGLQILAHFTEQTLAELRRFLADETLTPLDRLRGYFEANVEALAAQGYRGGCLLGNLGQELSDLSEPLRRQVEAGMAEWAALLGEGLALAQAQGQIAPSLDPAELGSLCLDGWQGAMLRMKVTHDGRPLRVFIHAFFDLLLRPD